MEELMLQLPDAPPGPYHDDHEALMDIPGDGLGSPAFSAYSYPGDNSMLDQSPPIIFKSSPPIGNDSKSVVPRANPISGDSLPERSSGERGEYGGPEGETKPGANCSGRSGGSGNNGSGEPPPSRPNGGGCRGLGKRRRRRRRYRPYANKNISWSTVI
ncbi:MAG: hypothetical protein MJE68_16565 [Proteobacteria bacterium]|nr:hypothetical protein [Pseudomonadota bacterium]